MINPRRSTVLISAGVYCCAVMLSAPVFAQAQGATGADSGQSRQEAQSVFNDLFGDEVARVSRTSNRDDDLELAQTMLEAAKTSADQQQLAIVILTQVVKLASRHPSGQSVAVEALGLLAEYDPQQRKVHQQQALVLLRRQGNEAFMQGAARFAQQNVEAKDYTAAGLQFGQAAQMAKKLQLKEQHEVYQAKADYYTSLSRAQKQIASLILQIKARPDNGSMHERLAWLYTFELDDPAEATQHLEKISNQELMINVMMATQQISEIAEDQALTLGRWYEKQSKSAGLSRAGKASSLKRAKAYFGQYLNQHAEAGLDRTRVELMIKQIDRELEGMNLQLITGSDPQFASSGATAPSNGTGKKSKKGKAKYINLLEKVKISRDAVAGNWKIGKGQLIADGNYGTAGLRFPVRIFGDYEMQVQFARTAGTGTVAIQIPVGHNTVSLMIQQTINKRPVTYMSGLTTINGRGLAENSTGVKPGTINNTRRYTVGIKVVHLSEEKAAIRVTLNGKQYTQWQGNPSSLRPYSYFSQAGGDRAPGVATYSSSLVIYGAVLKMTKGEAKGMYDGEAVADGDAKAEGDEKPRPGLTEAQRREMTRRRNEKFERARARGKRPDGRSDKR